MIALLVLAASAVRTDVLPIPPQYQANTSVWVQTMGQSQIETVCGVPPVSSLTTVACAEQGPRAKPYLYMPNPCTYPEASDVRSYAHLLCHEIAHTEGWHHVQ